MKSRLFAVPGIFLLIFLLSGCVTTGTGPVSEVKEREVGVLERGEEGKKYVRKLYCTSPGPRIMVGSVRCRAAQCRGKAPKGSGLYALLMLAGVPDFEGIADGLRDMFVSALQQTGCFKVLEREEMKEIQRELKLMGKEFKGPSADYLVTGAVTSINYTRKSGTLGGIRLPVIGGISTTKEKAQLAMDIRLVKVETGEIVLSKTYTAESGKTTFGVAGASTVGFGGALSTLSGTAMEEVARDIIVRAVYDIARFLVPDKVVEQRVTLR